MDETRNYSGRMTACAILLIAAGAVLLLGALATWAIVDSIMRISSM